MKLNQILQWTGTGFLLTMYLLMSFWPQLHPLNILAGVLGGACYLVWTLRVQNRPQQLVNLAGITIGCLGLIRWVVDKI